MTIQTTTATTTTTVNFTSEELDFLDEALRLGKVDYIKRAQSYAKESKRENDPSYQSYFKHKQRMFSRVRSKLLSADAEQEEQEEQEEAEEKKELFGKYLDEKKKKESEEFKVNMNGKTIKVKKEKVRAPSLSLSSSSLFGEEFSEAIESLSPSTGVFYQESQQQQQQEPQTIINTEGEILKQVFNCGACGRRSVHSMNIRVYRSSACRHPVLRAISENELICSRCKAWDYDTIIRHRKRGDLKLKDGRILKRNEVTKNTMLTHYSPGEEVKYFTDEDTGMIVGGEITL